MRTLSNNRNNAIGPWYVNSNNGPSALPKRKPRSAF